MGVKDHRSLVAWKEARALVLQVLDLSRTAWKPWASAVFGQLQRCSLSVQLNIAEGYAYQGTARYKWHLRVAYGSAVEAGDLLELLGSAELIGADRAKALVAHNVATQKLLWGLIRSLPGD